MQSKKPPADEHVCRHANINAVVEKERKNKPATSPGLGHSFLSWPGRTSARLTRWLPRWPWRWSGQQKEVPGRGRWCQRSPWWSAQFAGFLTTGRTSGQPSPASQKKSVIKVLLLLQYSVQLRHFGDSWHFYVCMLGCLGVSTVLKILAWTTGSLAISMHIYIQIHNKHAISLHVFGGTRFSLISKTFGHPTT